MTSLDTVLKSLRESYAKGLPDKIDHIKDLCHNRQLEGLRLAAQKLNGSGRSYGYPEVSDICEKLEKEAEINNWTEITNVVEELARVVQTL